MATLKQTTVNGQLTVNNNTILFSSLANNQVNAATAGQLFISSSGELILTKSSTFNVVPYS